MSIGNIIGKARKACGLTQTTLAARAGMAQPILSAIEHDTRNPTIKTLRRLARAMGLRLVVRLENGSGLGFEWSTGLATEGRSVGYAGTRPSAPGKTPTIAHPSPDIGYELKSQGDI